MGTIYVTNLNDSGAGSLREACATAGSRVIRFSVAGNIEAESMIELAEGDVTIDGSDAPVCLKGYGFIANCANGIIRHMRFRPGPNAGAARVNDALRCETNCNSLLIEYCSLSYSQDELFSVINNAKLVRLSHCIMSYAMVYDCFFLSDQNATQIEIDNCLIAHTNTRAPMFKGGYLRYYNNVMYNTSWAYFSPINSPIFVDIVGNYWKAGADTQPGYQVKNVLTIAESEYYNDSRFYWSDNTLDDFDIPFIWSDGEPIRYVAPLCYTNAPRSAADAYTYVLANAGAWYGSKRDDLDEQVVDHVTNGTGSQVDDPDDAGGWPDLTLM